MTTYLRRLAILILASFILSACGGDDPDGGAENTSAPHLLSSPQVSFVANATTTSEYDVTVSIEADGPNGIYSASVSLIGQSDESNFEFLELTNTGGTTWTGTTNTLLPLSSGTYKVENIILYDADPFEEGSSFQTAWYFELLAFSNTRYYVDQRDVYDKPNFNMIALGVSSIAITSFTLP